MKYKAIFDLEIGVKLKLVKEKNTSYGILKKDEIVTLEEITHFPTRFNVIDNNDKNWILLSHDFEEINDFRDFWGF